MTGWRILAVVGVGVALAVGCSSGDDEPSEAGESSPPAEEPTTTEPPAVTSPTTAAAPASPTTGPPATEPPGGSGAVPLPDVVGMDLQLAQDTMQAAGFYGLTSHDATGEGRLQVLDRNWTVCDQTPAAGAPTRLDAVVDLGAVKDDEPCP